MKQNLLVIFVWLLSFIFGLYIKNRTKTELGFINVKQKQQTKNSFSKENANIENRLAFCYDRYISYKYSHNYVKFFLWINNLFFIWYIYNKLFNKGCKIDWLQPIYGSHTKKNLLQSAIVQCSLRNSTGCLFFI